MSYSSLPAFKLFQLTSLSCALALAGCGGGDGTDIVAPKPDLPGGSNNGGGNNGGNDNGGVQTPIEDFSLQKLYTDPTNIKLTDEPVTFNVTVKAVAKSGGAAIDRSVSLSVDDSTNTGVTIQGANVQSTNDKGEATYELKLNPLVLNDQQKADLLINGFGLKATAKQSSNGAEITQVLTVRVSKEGSGSGGQTEVSTLNIENSLQTSSVSNNKLNPYGDTGTFRVVLKNTEGARVEGVTVGMGIADLKGIAIVGGDSQITNQQGVAIFSIKVDENLSAAERTKLLKGVAYAINIAEKNGATKQKTGTLAVAIPVSDYKLQVQGNTKPINAYGAVQPLTIQANPANNNVPTQIKGAKATIKINNVLEGVSLSSETLTLDANGQAMVNLVIAENLSAASRTALEKDGISYTVTLFEPNGAITTTVEPFNSSVYIPAAEYQIKSATNSKERISSFGSTVDINFQVNDKQGGAIAKQKVMAQLPENLVKAGLTLDSSANKETNANGVASYTVRVPVGLTETQRNILETAGSFILTATLTEASGATSTVASEPVRVTAASETILSSKSIPSAVNILKNQFQIQVSGKRPDGSAAAAKPVKLTISNVTGVSIQGNEQTTDASGNVVFTVNLSQDLTEAQRQALVKSGIPYTVTLTDEDGVATSKYKAPVIIPVAEYKLNFSSSSSNKLLSTGGVTTLSFRVNDKNGGAIANQTVTASLPSSLTQKGLITLETATNQVTDAQGKVSYLVRIPEGLSAAQRAELEKAGGFVLNARLVESSGASVNANSSRVPVTADPSRSKTILTAKTTPNVVNLLKDQFTIQVSAKRPNGSAAAGRSVKLAINNVKGISIEGGEQTTNSAGNAVFTVNIAQSLTLDQRKALETSGIAYTATLTDEDGVATEEYSVNASVPDAEYKINFGSSSNAQLSSSGGSTVVSFRVNDKDGGVIDKQKVTVNLPTALVSAGLLTLDSAATQTTDDKGMVSYTVRIPTGLTTAQKSKLEKASGFFLTANLIEASGASTSTNSAPISISDKIQKSLTVLTSETTPKVVNVLKDQFTIKISGKRKDGSAAADKVVKLALNKVTGVTVKDNEQKTDASGSATFVVNVSQDLTQAQREALVKSGITYTASLTDNDGVATSNYNASVIIPAAQYQINFGTSDKVQLSSSGGSTIISFRVNDKNGGVIANQSVTATLPKALVDTGLLTLDGAATQTTDDKGVVSYKVSVPAGLNKTQKDALEAAKGFVLTAKAVEESGASSTVSSATITIGSDIGQSDIQLTSTSNPKVVTVTDSQFTIQVSAKRPDSSAAVGNSVKLIINPTAGVTIQGNEQITNAAGNAVFTVNLSQDLTQQQRDDLVASGIVYTATITDDDGTEATLENQKVEVAQPATSLEFASVLTPSISELGGSGSIIVKLLNKASQTPVEGQAVTIQLGKKALDYGVTVNEESATTDFSGETTFIVTIPEGLTAVERAELKRVGINYQLSYVEKGVEYSKIDKVNIATPAVDITVLNAPNLINNRPFYTLNGEGDTTVINARLSTSETSFDIAGQPIELTFADKDLAALLTVNGKLGSATNTVSTGADGAANFTVIVPNNLTQEQKDKLQNKRLTAILKETLTGNTQEIQFNVQSTKAAIDLIAITPKALNLNGGETQIEVIAQDSKDNVIEGQKVFLALPAAIAAQGVILTTSGTQTTNDSGKAVFTLAVPAGLTQAQKDAIGRSFKVALTAADANGNIATNTSTVTTSTPDAATGTTENIAIGANKVVNTQGDSFKVFVQVANDKGSIANRDVRLNVDEPIKTGVTVTNGTAKTNSDGVATFDLTLEPGANVDQTLLEAGIKLTATTITAENIEINQDYIVAVDKATIDSYQILASSDKSTLNTGGDQTNATFRVTDSNGGILVGVPVQLSIDNLEASGAALTKASTVMTDAEGKVDVGVLLAANSINARLNHSVVINAKIVTPVYDANGNVTMDVREEKSLSLSATGTVITLEASNTQLKDGDSTTVSTTLIDGAGRAIANASMDLVNAAGESVLPKDAFGAPMFATTDADGKASLTLNEATLKAANAFDDNGNLRIYARALGEKSLNTQTSANSINLVQVSQAGISFSDIDSLYDVNAPKEINVQIRTDSSDEANDLLGKSVELQTTIGTFANNDVIITKAIDSSNINGNIITVPVVLTSTLAGSATLEAKVLGVFANGSSGALKYQTTADTRFRATTPAKMLFQAVKSVITPGSSTEVVATVKDKNDVPVEGQTVVFSRAADSSAGRLSAATAITDRRGEARVVYTANDSSPIGGVIINGRLLNDSENIGTKTTNITVSEEAVYTTLAFSNKLSSDTIYYTVQGSISVMDGSGRAVPNKEVSIKSYAVEYAQGLVCLLDSTTTYQAADEIERNEKGDIIKVTTPEPKVSSERLPNFLQSGWKPTEDSNYNYTLDKDNDPLLNEDKNNNNSVDAINPVAIIGGTVSDDGYTFVTDSEGRVDFSIRYPMRYSNWVKVKFDATTFLDGSENTQSINYQLPSAESDLIINNTSIQTPWIDNTSPFGHGGAVCTSSMNVKINDQNDTTKVILSPYQPNQPGYFVSINGVNSNRSSIAYNSFIVDFNQAFEEGSRISVRRNGFDFSKTITFK